MSAVQLEARNATSADLVRILQDQQAHKLDVVVPALNMQSQGGVMAAKVAEISEDGVTSYTGKFRPTEIFDEGVSAKLGIPRQYLRRMREERPDLYDKNVNGWLRGSIDPATGATVHAADDRAFLLRLFKSNEPGSEGVARAFLSDRYGITMDNLDILTAVNKGIQESGITPTVRVTDLSERRMRVRFEFPDVNTLAPGLLNGYNSPFREGGARRAGQFDELRQLYGAHHIFSDDTAPIAFLGIDLSNSETGGGAMELAQVIMMVKCTNGWVMPVKSDGIRRVHLGARLAQGNVKASAETVRKAGELVVSETKDTVSQWLSTDNLEGLIAGLNDKAAKPIVSATETVPAVVTGLGFSEDEAKSVLDLFVLGGQPTAGGLAQAVSAFAQTVEDVDRAYEIELATVPALNAAAAA